MLFKPVSNIKQQIVSRVVDEIIIPVYELRFCDFRFAYFFGYLWREWSKIVCTIFTYKNFLCFIITIWFFYAAAI